MAIPSAPPRDRSRVPARSRARASCIRRSRTRQRSIGHPLGAPMIRRHLRRAPSPGSPRSAARRLPRRNRLQMPRPRTLDALVRRRTRSVAVAARARAGGVVSSACHSKPRERTSWAVESRRREQGTGDLIHDSRPHAGPARATGKLTRPRLGATAHPHAGAQARVAPRRCSACVSNPRADARPGRDSQCDRVAERQRS